MWVDMLDDLHGSRTLAGSEDGGSKARELVEVLVRCMAFCWAVKAIEEAPVVGGLVAVNLCNQPWVGLSFPVGHVRAESVKQVKKKAHAKNESHAAGKEVAD